MLNNNHRVLIKMAFLILHILVFIPLPVAAEDNLLDHALVKPKGATIVPDHFLRRWDPVTLFFNSSIGPDNAGPEDYPEKYVTLTPHQPGAFTWLDSRTLQFRPAEPWPPLTRFKWDFNGRSVKLSTLMSAPKMSIPRNGVRGLNPVEAITLTFHEPVDPNALARMITIELRPLPGVDKHMARWLDKDNFQIKVLERANLSDDAVYVINLNEPISQGHRATVHLRLSLEDGVDEAFQRIDFYTAETFRVKELGCSGNTVSVTPEGVSYPPENAIACSGSMQREVIVGFSSQLEAVGTITARNFIRITPAVKDLAYQTYGNQLTATGNFQSEVLYNIELMPEKIEDNHGRLLDIQGPHQVYLYFPARTPFLKVQQGNLIIERYGPQMIPLEGRGHERIDIRIYPIDPLDRSFWPFPDDPLAINEHRRPPAPGEKALPYDNPNNYISTSELKNQLAGLGSPAVSQIHDIPLRQTKNAAAFGLDLKPMLETIRGGSKPGTYLVGLRKLDDDAVRAWMRVLVTDLCLSTVEEVDGVRFVVTSLKSGKPVKRAIIKLEGSYNKSHQETRWVTIASGKTDSQGVFTWKAPGLSNSSDRYLLRRIVVQDGDDTLVLDPSNAPDRFQNNVWEKSSGTWLQWALEETTQRQVLNRELCHTFTERPVYRPDEPVHIKGYVRDLKLGEFTPKSGSGFLVVDGPGDLEWRYPLELTEVGSFYHKFEEEKLPTGEYYVYFEGKDYRCDSTDFRKEAYRVPKFEVLLHGPRTSSLDNPFEIGLTAKYYAGGRVSGQPVRWRVTQFPYTWSPRQLTGFIYSTDARFSSQGRFLASPEMAKGDETDDNGGAAISIDPANEPSAQPRRYVIEATVTGADDQTVTATHSVNVLPPFILGVKVPRYIPKAKKIAPQIIAIGPDDALIKGQKIKVRFLKREWHSHLEASDFSSGDAKYVTEVVDKPVHETSFISDDKPKELELPIKQAGVYIVELSASDSLGRVQVVSVDLFAGGDTPVTWSRPPTKVLKVTPEETAYAPGQTARLIIESPFQNGLAFAVIESPDGVNAYEWIDISKGSGVLNVKIKKIHMPALPVHFMLLRGRIKDNEPASVTRPDLGKPATLASTCWIKVKTVQHEIQMALSYPDKVQPGEEVALAIHLEDENGKPMKGEAVLWLVDQAVLALGKEKRLDPLPDFIVHPDTFLSIRDTRNMIIGHLAFQEMPGGDAALEESKAMSPQKLLDQVTVRKNFAPVPYYNPVIRIDRSGKKVLKIKMPDNLTNFKIRAKVVDAKDRFGYAKGQISVRLPVIVQPVLPRFVRPGDRFTAVAIGRIVEGEGGDGLASIHCEGLQIEGPAQKSFVWQQNRPQRIEYQANVPTPGYTPKGRPMMNEVTVKLGVERTKDHGRDAFEVKLPIQADRKPVHQRQIQELNANTPVILPQIKEKTRPGTLKRSLLVARQPALARMAAGLDYLLSYPHGCTEQRISRARAILAAKKFRDLMYQQESTDQLEKTVRQTLEFIESIVDSHQLAAYWPGSEGNVTLTAWVVQFMIEARDAGFHINEGLLNKFTNALRRSLRSDYGNFIIGSEYAERCWALTALSEAGMADTAYAAELSRKTQYLNIESAAQVLRALIRSEGAQSPMVRKLEDKLWEGIIFRLYQGQQIYAGLQESGVTRNRLILPSEVRSISQVLRTATIVNTQQSRDNRQLLLNALVTLGKADGWGSTNANSEALLALSEFVMSGGDTDKSQRVTLTSGTETKTIDLGPEKALHYIAILNPDEISLTLQDTTAQTSLILRSEVSYLPEQDGSYVKSNAQGFVVTAELLKYLSRDAPPERLEINAAGSSFEFSVGDIVEYHVEIVNPEPRHFVAVAIPLAAGMEPLNPALATAPPEAEPNGGLTLEPTYTAFMDDQIAYYYNSLDKGTYHFYFRIRATVPGTFIQPAAFSEMMYDLAVSGNANGARIVIKPNSK